MTNCLLALLTVYGLAFVAPQPARAQAPAPQAAQTADEAVGQVASVQGSASVTRNGVSGALKVNDDIFKGDILQTGGDGALSVTFDDETTFNLTANARIAVDEFIYEEGGSQNAALFTVGLGTVAFVANQVAKTGDMKIATPSATMGIRGTTGVVEVPEAGSAGEAKIKLYPDTDGRVGRIEVFAPGAGGARLGILSAGSSAFAIRPGAGGRFMAVPFRIAAQEAARDRGVVQRLFAAHNVGRGLINQRRQLRQQRQPNLQRPLQQRQLQPGRPNLRGQPNFAPGQRGPQQLQPRLQQPLRPGQPALQQRPQLRQPMAPNAPAQQPQRRRLRDLLNPRGGQDGAR